MGLSLTFTHTLKNDLNHEMSIIKAAFCIRFDIENYFESYIELLLF